MFGHVNDKIKNFEAVRFSRNSKTVESFRHGRTFAEIKKTIKKCFSQGHTQSFLGIPVHLFTVYQSGTEEFPAMVLGPARIFF